ncbi:MAG: hypothetical protein Q4G58_12870, partial [bacterium]|nr:hypothetical protein [bacterium]
RDVQFFVKLKMSTAKKGTGIYTSKMVKTEAEEPKVTKKATEKPKATKKPEQAQKSYYGSFKITSFKMARISAMFNEEAEAVVGKTIEFGKDSFKGIQSTVKAPNYKESVETKEKFEEDFKEFTTFKELGRKADQITAVEITNADEIGRIFYVIDNNTIAIYQDGALFTAVRK